MAMRVLDLCAGTGSATKAFQDRGHDVDTLDVVGGHTFNMDVRKFKPWKKYDFVWASPPCTEFSLAGWRRGACKDRKPNLSIVEACFRICNTAPYWVLENPRGCLRYFIGKPTITVKYQDFGGNSVKPTDLWLSDNFPFFYSTTKRKVLEKSEVNWVWSGSPIRSMVPYGLSLAICKALERELQ